MKRQDLLLAMKNAVGTKDPVVFFGQMVDAFGLLFDKIDTLENELRRVKTNSALAIKWEPKIASDMIAEQVEGLRQNKEDFFQELTALKIAFAENKVTQSYDQFCQFWLETLGWHPFLHYKK
jgi:hypothetical protein